MDLSVKRPDRIVPEYSLTGDLLSFERCQLQYRYYNGSALPPSRPVQMWYGEFIHGMLEAAFRLWRATNGALAFPWPCHPLEESGAPAAPPDGLAENDIRTLGWPIEVALMHQGKRARSRTARKSAYRRAEAAVNLLGPHLFPLIADAEQKVIGTRALLDLPGTAVKRSNHYALHGVIDVLTNVEMAQAPEGNVIRDAVRAACPDLSGTFEVIVDYKGSHRPATKLKGGRKNALWELGEWQVLTYAWLRKRQQLSNPVAAGILIYINELAPSSQDIDRLNAEIKAGSTDVEPKRGDADYYALAAHKQGNRAKLTEAFRFRRAIRVIPVTDAKIREATDAFDRIVRDIEYCVVKEAAAGDIGSNWAASCDEEDTCAACDFRFFCKSDLAKKAVGDNRNPDDDDDDS